MRRIVLGFGLFLSIVSESAAQDISSAVAENWARFDDTCARALTDPQGFLDAHPKVGAYQESLVNISPDGQVVVANTSANGLFLRVQFLGMPGRLAVLCEAMGLSGFVQEHGLSYESGGHDDHDGETTAALVPGNLIADAALPFLQSLPETTVGGGLVPDGLPAFVPQSGDLTYANYIFSVQTPMAGRAVFVYANAHATSFDLTTLNYIEASQ